MFGQHTLTVEEAPRQKFCNGFVCFSVILYPEMLPHRGDGHGLGIEDKRQDIKEFRVHESPPVCVFSIIYAYGQRRKAKRNPRPGDDGSREARKIYIVPEASIARPGRKGKEKT